MPYSPRGGYSGEDARASTQIRTYVQVRTVHSKSTHTRAAREFWERRIYDAWRCGEFQFGCYFKDTPSFLPPVRRRSQKSKRERKHKQSGGVNETKAKGNDQCYGRFYGNRYELAPDSYRHVRLQGYLHSNLSRPVPSAKHTVTPGSAGSPAVPYQLPTTGLPPHRCSVPLSVHAHPTSCSNRHHARFTMANKSLSSVHLSPQSKTRLSKIKSVASLRPLGPFGVRSKLPAWWLRCACAHHRSLAPMELAARPSLRMSFEPC